MQVAVVDIFTEASPNLRLADFKTPESHGISSWIPGAPKKPSSRRRLRRCALRPRKLNYEDDDRAAVLIAQVYEDDVAEPNAYLIAALTIDDAEANKENRPDNFDVGKNPSAPADGKLFRKEKVKATSNNQARKRLTFKSEFRPLRI